VAFGLALVGAACTSSGPDGGGSPSTTEATTTTTSPGALDETAQRWVDLREDNDCQGTRFGEVLEEIVGPVTFNDPNDQVATEEDWPEVERRVLPVAREYATTKQAMIDAVEAATWPPDARQAIDEQLVVQRARVAWLRQIGAATSVDEFNVAFELPLPSDRSPAVRYALGIPPTKEIHTAHFCANR
jgi:hypothetical protein